MQTNLQYPSDAQFVWQDLEVMSEAKRYNLWIFEQFRKYLISGKVLEVGAGIGNISRFIVDNNKGGITYLLEPDQYCLDVLSNRYGNVNNVKLLVGKFPDYFLERSKEYTNYFHTIFLFNVLEHLQDDLKALEQLRDLLVLGGRLLIVVPALPILYGNIDRRLGHYRRYTKMSLFKIAMQGKFSIDRIHYTNLVGALGWYINFVLLKRNSQNSSQVRFFSNFILPLQQFMEKIIKPPIGQTLVTILTKKL